ncbi:MAG: universal stress protein [Desulfobacterales bacterium]|jgi:nucleotide-binding universal stress UspA family protein|nr:universal stress protein [Desulfobacterales bacterium]
MNLNINRNILIAADESENAKRAVLYVAKLLGGMKGFKVTVLHIIREPEEDYFPDDAKKDKWYKEYKENIDKVMEEYRQILIAAGFATEDVSTRSTLRYCPSMAECILAERDKLEYGTLVVGRKGLSRKEEFLFGSVSNKIVRTARNCTVWVVE